MKTHIYGGIVNTNWTALLVVVSMALGASATAHHSPAMLYDLSKEIVVEGTVTRYVLGNPHLRIYFDVEDDGQTVQWMAEGGSRTVLIRAGWDGSEVEPGDKIIMASFGQGSDALLFEVTDAIESLSPRNGTKGALANRKAVNNYQKYLKFRDLLTTEMGIRAEAPTQTALTVLYRNNKMLMGLVGGKCTKCGTPQFPKSPICVNPDCNAFHSQEDHEFADATGHIKAFTSDLLSVSVAPPNCYGMVQFEGGGRLMADFTDCEAAELSVGQPVVMTMRKRYEDRDRGFHGYFWKAIPQTAQG